MDQRPALAFDHRQIFDAALKRLRGKLRYQPLGLEFLPEKSTLTQLQRLYETILGEFVDAVGVDIDAVSQNYRSIGRMVAVDDQLVGQATVVAFVPVSADGMASASP